MLFINCERLVKFDNSKNLFYIYEIYYNREKLAGKYMEKGGKMF